MEKTTSKKDISKSKQAQIVSKRCAIIGSISLAFPFLATFILFLMSNIPALSKGGTMPEFLEIIVVSITFIGILAGPVFLAIAMICGAIMFSRASRIKSLDIRKKYLIIGLTMIIITALIAFLLPSIYNSSGFMDFSIDG